MMSNTTTVLCFTAQPVYLLIFLYLFAAPLHFLIIRMLIVRFRTELPRHKILLCLSVSDNLQTLGTGLISFIGLRLQPSITSQSCQMLRQVLEVVSMQTHIASTGFILLLAIERYIACIHSLRLHSIVTHSRANFAVTSIWLISILCGLSTLHPNEPNYTGMAVSNNARILLLYTATVVVSSFFLIIIQARLYRLSRTKMKVEPVMKFGTQREKDDLLRRQIKLGFAASVVITMYVVCMCPIACLNVYLFLNPMKDLLGIKQGLTILAMLNTFLDPFVYGFGMSDIRQGIKREYKNLKKCIVERLVMG